MQEMQVQYFSWEDPLKMATHSSIPAWKTPWAEDPGGYSQMSWKELDTTEHKHKAHFI